MDNLKRKGRYRRVFKQINELTQKVDNPISRMSTIVAVLHNKFDYNFWTGFYLLEDGQLIVGPYQGPPACLKLAKDKGVCWAGINQEASLVVPDVEKFPGHIACDSRSKSEIVIPLKNRDGKIVGILDVDSKDFDSFNDIDKEELEKIVELVFE